MDKRVYSELKNRIIHGIYTPGQRLKKKELAQEFKIDLNALDQVLHQLVDDQCLLQYQTEGYVVADISITKSKELLDVREALEIKALSQLLNELNPMAKEKLNSLANGIIKAWQRKNLTQLTYGLQNWKTTYIDLIKNNTLQAYMAEIQTNLNRVENYLIHDESYQQIIITYIKGISQFLEDKDQSKIEPLVRTYTESTKDLLESMGRQEDFRY